jgi:hypothetical protein
LLRFERVGGMINVLPPPDLWFFLSLAFHSAVPNSSHLAFAFPRGLLVLLGFERVMVLEAALKSVPLLK